MIKGEPIYINGYGETWRDFRFIENVRQINLLAATFENPESINQVHKVDLGERNAFNQLYKWINLKLFSYYPDLQGVRPVYRDFRG